MRKNDYPTYRFHDKQQEACVAIQTPAGTLRLGRWRGGGKIELTQEQAAELATRLIRFQNTGRLEE